MSAWLLLLSLWGADGDFDHDYGAWEALLADGVIVGDDGRTSTVDYAALAERRGELGRVLEDWSRVSRAEFAAWDHARQLAFLINVYNAWTIELILANYPGLDSIRDLGSLFRSPWEKPLVEVFGETLTLDEIEHEMIRANYAEPLIHAAVNCASCGCPALRAEPFVGARLDRQLDDAMRRFLADDDRNRVLPGRDRVEVSPIFKWFDEDFEARYGGVREFLRAFSDALADDPDEAALLAGGDFSLRYTDYDWTLNDRGNCSAP